MRSLGFIFKVSFLFVIFFIFISIAPVWADRYGFWVTPFSEYFVWKEYDDQGRMLLKENGLRGGIGLLGENIKEILGRQLFTCYEAALYGGLVKYDGQTWGGTPLKGDVLYLGLKGEINLGIYKYFSIYGIILYLGLGDEVWVRDLTKVPGGYKEVWGLLFYKLGIKGKVDILRGELLLDGWIGSDIITTNRAKFSESFPYSCDAESYPDGALFWGAKMTYKIEKFFVKAYYHHYKWNKSKPVFTVILATPVLVYQPESEENVYGMSIGFLF